MGQKVKKCFSIDIEKVGTINNLAVQNGIGENEIVDKLLGIALAMKCELTSAERYHYQRQVINTSLDGVLRTFGIMQYEGSITDKVVLLYKLCIQNVGHQNNEYRNGIQELSLFEVLNRLKDWDNVLYKKLLALMGRKGRLRDRYFQIYPK